MGGGVPVCLFGGMWTAQAAPAVIPTMEAEENKKKTRKNQKEIKRKKKRRRERRREEEGERV